MERQDNGYGFHYGLEYVMSQSEEMIEETVQRLERKQNRAAKAEKAEKKSLRRLNHSLGVSLARGFGNRAKKQMDELERKFRRLYNLRAKG